jgi:hypothetical protein
MDTDRDMAHVEPFVPLGPTPRRRLISGILIAPLLWLVALAVVAVTVNRTDAIELGVLIALAAALVATGVLALLRAGRERERARHGPPR